MYKLDAQGIDSAGEWGLTGRLGAKSDVRINLKVKEGRLT